MKVRALIAAAAAVAAFAAPTAAATGATVTQGQAAVKRYAQLISADRTVASARVTRCHRWYGAVKCWMTVRYRVVDGVQVIDREVVFAARCRGKVRAWSAFRDVAPAGCEDVE